MKAEVLIYADTVGRGKTTVLKAWSQNQKDIGGVLSPKMEGKRFFEFVPSGDLLAMESCEAGLLIGKYNFDASHFAEAEKRIWADWENPSIHTLIIDEIGPLEIKKNEGFHQLLERILNLEITAPRKLILVVRDYCLEDFLRKYPTDNAKIITENYLKHSPIPRPVGIVLCGGNSSRMQLDKALIEYHGMPQWKYVYNLLTPFCESVYLSLNAQQAASWDVPEEMEVVEDAGAYLNHGPMTGLLSVLSKVGNKPVFLAACDYPLLRMENLLDLYKRRSSNRQVVCFKNNERPEPLISIFGVSAYPDLQDYFARGKDSVSKFIRESNTAYIDVSDPEFLRNVNNPEELKLIKNHLNND